MTKKSIGLLAFIFILGSMQQMLGQKTTVFWVNSIQTDCNKGTGKDKCLMIQRSDQMESDKWEHFTASIEGFTYEPGYFQKIEVREEEIRDNALASDASSIRFTQTKRLEKIEDPIWNIEGDWVVQKLLGKKIDKQGQVPALTIDLESMQVSGSNGCNRFTGNISFISEDTFTTGPIASTRKMCLEMTIPDKFDKLFFMPWNYSLENNTLLVQDNDGKELMILKK